MRTSILSRSVIAIASLALGSVALVAAPAQAASASGITMDMVYTANSGLRFGSGPDDPNPTPHTLQAVRSILSRSCTISSDIGEVLLNVGGIPTTTHRGGYGLVAYGEVYNEIFDTSRDCIVGAAAVNDGQYVLTGSGTLTVWTVPVGASDDVVPTPRSKTQALSGDAFSMAADAVPANEQIVDATFAATGSSVGTYTYTRTTKVLKPKTVKQKKAAKKAYTTKLKGAKKSYAKALKKAGSSKSKKAAAKQAYSKKRAKAKATYKKAVATYKLITKTHIGTRKMKLDFTTPRDTPSS